LSNFNVFSLSSNISHLAQNCSFFFYHNKPDSSTRPLSLFHLYPPGVLELPSKSLFDFHYSYFLYFLKDSGYCPFHMFYHYKVQHFRTEHVYVHHLVLHIFPTSFYLPGPQNGDCEVSLWNVIQYL